MQKLKFPERDIIAFRRDQAYHEGALVCRRSHVIDAGIRVDESIDPHQKCTKCGASMVIGCLNCGVRIRGYYFVPGVIGGFKYTPPGFCDGCGSAHPWATREQRIFELENILDQQDISEPDRIFISDRLRELREMDGSDTKAEERVWKTLAQRGRRFLALPPVQRIGETLVTEGLRATLFS